MAVIQFPLSLIGSDPAAFLNIDTRHILPAIGVGTAGLTSHYCLSNAFRSGDATLNVPLFHANSCSSPWWAGRFMVNDLIFLCYSVH